ncbi:MAG: sulfatase-like hydrolase/transferase [Polyangia bacterium]
MSAPPPPAVELSSSSPPPPALAPEPRRRGRLRERLGRLSGPLLGTLAVAGLYALLFGLDFLLGAELQVMGVSDPATQRMVMERYGRLLISHQARILGVFVAVGLLVGAGLQLGIKLWERSGAWPRKRPQPSRETPVELPPSPWSRRRRFAVSLGAGLLVHLLLLGRAVGLRPSLFSEALPQGGEPGGLRRLVIFLTHGRGQWLLSTLAVAALLFFALGPLFTPRARRFFTGHLPGLFTDLWELHRRKVLAAAAGLLALGLVLALALAQRTGAPPPRSVRKPSVLLIAVDSLRADRVFATPGSPDAGRPQRVAPAISELSRRAVRFESAHVSVPRTFPSLVTLLTGRLPFRHGIRTMFPTPAERSHAPKALPAILRGAGYRTAVISDFCGEIFSRIDLGFEQVAVPPFDAKTLVLQRSLTVHKNLLPYVSDAAAGAAGQALAQRIFPELGSLAELSSPQLLTDRALSALRGFRGQGEPFFLTVFYSTSHFPYAAPGPYYRRFADPRYRGPFLYHKPPLAEVKTPADIEQVRALYDGAVAANDDAVRRLLGGLKELGLEDDTLVVLLSDHGENLFDEPGRGMGHGDHLEGDHSLRVPLLLLDPVHRFAPHAVPGLVRDIDLVPTLLGLLGLPSAELDGVDLLPLLRGEQQSLGLSALSETELWFTPSGPGFAADQRLPYPDVTATTAIAADDDIAVSERYRDLVTVAKHRSLRTERLKIIYRPTRGGPRYSLFDVQADPAELHDLSGEQPALLQQMKAALFQALAKDPTVERDGDFLLPR